MLLFSWYLDDIQTGFLNVESILVGKVFQIHVAEIGNRVGLKYMMRPGTVTLGIDELLRANVG